MATSEAITMVPITAGVFCWNELATRDVDASCRFYTTLLGWTAETNKGDGTPYTMFYSDGHPVGGCLAIDESWPADMPSRWGSCIAVDDVDAATDAAQALGASVYCPPTDIPGIGRFATLGDPCGAVFAVFTTSHGCGCGCED